MKKIYCIEGEDDYISIIPNNFHILIGVYCGGKKSSITLNINKSIKMRKYLKKILRKLRNQIMSWEEEKKFVDNKDKEIYVNIDIIDFDTRFVFYDTKNVDGLGFIFDESAIKKIHKQLKKAIKTNQEFLNNFS